MDMHSNFTFPTFSRKSKSTQRVWSELIDEYLKIRSNNMMVYILVDSRRNKLFNTDLEFIKKLKENKSMFTILLTKIDELKKQDDLNLICKTIFDQLIELSGEEEEEYPLIFAVSGKYKLGMSVLKHHIFTTLSGSPGVESRVEVPLSTPSTTSSIPTPSLKKVIETKFQKSLRLKEVERKNKFVFQSKFLKENIKSRNKKHQKIYERINNSQK
jgi:hypothetical protein